MRTAALAVGIPRGRRPEGGQAKGSSCHRGPRARSAEEPPRRFSVAVKELKVRWHNKYEEA